MNLDNLKREARGRWPGILGSLGIEVGNGKHTKCPACGGKDRFRFDDKDGDGTFFCNQCGSGDGFTLIQNALNVDFKESMAEVERLFITVKPSRVLKESKITPETLRAIFVKSKQMKKGDPVSLYLQSRGIVLIPESLRYMPKCYDTETKKDHPAMLAVFTSKDGKAITMHRTYLQKNGQKAEMEKGKKLLPALEKMTGGVIRLWPEAIGKIGIAEGIETALACYELFGIPTWSAVSSTLMESFEPPKGITEVVIFGDNDKNCTGQKAAYTLANKLILRNKIKASVQIPEQTGDDWLDEYSRNFNT